MSKSTKPAPSFRIPGPGAPQKPLTPEEQKRLLIQQAEQKLGAISEGVIFNLVHAGSDKSPEEVVDYAFKVAEAFILKRYGVTFTPHKPADQEAEQ